MIDTHCHLTYEPLASDQQNVLARARAAGVIAMISVGTSPDDASQAVALAQREKDVFATVGLHPHYARQWTDRARVVETMRALAQQPKVVAFGEMGLDKHYPDPPLAEQRRIFEWQLSIAAELKSFRGPLVIHDREATDETLSMLGAMGISGGRCIFHCFTGNEAEVEKVLQFGANVGFTGIVTFRNATDVAAAAKRVPLDRLLIETDSPYLTPEPHRKVRPNEPRYLPHVAQFLARQRDMAPEDFVAAVDSNARRVFNLPAA